MHEVLKLNGSHQEICEKICRWHMTQFFPRVKKKKGSLFLHPWPEHSIFPLEPLPVPERLPGTVGRALDWKLYLHHLEQVIISLSEPQVPCYPKHLLSIW